MNRTNMALGWNEIKDRAVTFSKEWENTSSEDAEAKSFLEAFFTVFGISHYVSTLGRNIEFEKIGTFEHKVKKLNEHDGYIDLFWKGTMLVEMKSKGKDLDKAFIQAKEYTQKLKPEEIPKYTVISNIPWRRICAKVNKLCEKSIWQRTIVLSNIDLSR